MTKHTYGLLAFLTLLMIIVGCRNDSDNNVSDNLNQNGANTDVTPQLTLSVAASLADVMKAIQTDYEDTNNMKLTFILGGSGTLAQQIQQGAPTDVFISANQDWMDTLEDDGFLMMDTRDDVTGNHLVMIKNKSADLDYDSIADLNTEDGQIAVGNPESVPAGKYTEQALKSVDKWDELDSSIVLAKDVRQVLTYVETGNAEIGFVYESDALISDDVEIMTKSEAKMHDPIVYPGAVINDTDHETEAKAFIDYMLSDKGQKRLAEYGFVK